MNGYILGMQIFSLNMSDCGLLEWLCGRVLAARMPLWEIVGCRDAAVGRLLAARTPLREYRLGFGSL